MKVLDEIKKVGFSNWVWWVFYCERDEFHTRLSSVNLPDYNLKNEEYINARDNLIIDRQRAHDIDMEIG
jgi:hypothetical protein